MYKKIMVALDGSEVAQRGLREAIRLAVATGGRLDAVYIVDRSALFSYASHFDPDALLAASRDEGVRVLGEAERAMREAGVAGEGLLLETDLLDEEIAERIARGAQELDADLVVLGTHGRRGVKRAVLGSVAERFLRVSACPVLMVRGERAA
ncbi:universal stress protein [Burkholderia sp. FERM BP-3421]|jgi:nucleotide-binding universal stress UspA family protein|uniref:universal stress protein n=1 Tax=Burkholderia sp. FERM BP-3421 TaxID=1494466 RepID=UPI0023611963|nr:universal stress protein [Burkholderia sp. FERM BP-3421]WDD92228.1 universal stress protein [Burkholderia sp. FERM BP-3421]